MAFVKNAERCRQFYQEYGLPMLEQHFHAQLPALTIGLAGEGSDCFGYDDPLSADHDYGIGFCIWLDEALERDIGEELRHRYRQLCLDASPAIRAVTPEFSPPPSPLLEARRGVMTSQAYYERLLHYHIPAEGGRLTMTDALWLSVSESDLAAAVNGTIFHEGNNQFSRFRSLLQAYYPDRVRRLRLAEQIHLFSQNGQYNYPRMMARGDLLTAKLCMLQAVRAAMAVSYLLCRRYAPYDKWMRRGMEDFTLLPDLASLLDQTAALEPSTALWEKISYSSRSVPGEDPVCRALEQTAAMLLSELRRQGLCTGSDLFLDQYCKQIAEGIT